MQDFTCVWLLSQSATSEGQCIIIYYTVGYWVQDIRINGYQKRTQKYLSPDGIQTHHPPCSGLDALTSELLGTRW